MNHTIDLSIIVACLICTFTIGIFASKILHRDRKTTDDYFLAGRDMKGWVTGVSFALVAINADVAPLYVGMSAAMGVSVCWFFLSRFSIAWLILATLFAVKWRQLGISTGPEFFSLRFKGNQGKFVRVYASLYAVALGAIPWIGAGLLGLHMIADPDMLVVGKVGWGPNLHQTRLVPDEQYTHISLWCLLSSPLLIGCDMNDMDDFTYSLLSNDEVIAVNQDKLGSQAKQITKGDTQVWAKDLSDGCKAVGLFNVGSTEQNVNFKFADAGISGKCKIRDLWRQKDLGEFEEAFEARVPAHGVVLIKVISQQK